MVNTGRKRGKKKNRIDQALEPLSQFHFKTAEDVEHLYLYQDGEYIRGEAFVKSYVESLFANDADTGLCNEVINHLKRRNYAKRAEFNRFTGEIPTQSGLLNLETGTLSNFTPDKIFTFKIQAKYNPDSHCEGWKKFIEEILPNEDDRAALQQYAGYCLWSRMPYHKIAFLVGSGRNGKSAFLRALTSILGDNNVSNIKIDYLNGDHRFAATNLYGKLLNVSSEPSIRWPLQTELLKHLSGEDWFDGEVKGIQNPIRWKPFTKHFVLANKLPKVNDTSEGWWDRVHLIIFEQQFTETLGNQIPNIEDQWLGDDESRSAILNWLIEGWINLRTTGKFTQSKSQREAMIQFKRMSDPVAAFLIEWCTYEPDAFILREELYVAYKSYAQNAHATIESDKTFYMKVRLQPGVRDGDKKIGGKTKRAFFGVRLKTEGDEDAENDDLDAHVAQDAHPTIRQTIFEKIYLGGTNTCDIGDMCDRPPFRIEVLNEESSTVKIKEKTTPEDPGKHVKSTARFVLKMLGNPANRLDFTARMGGTHGLSEAGWLSVLSVDPDFEVTEAIVFCKSLKPPSVADLDQGGS